MGPMTVIGESFRSLGKNKARTALSILGIVIGIAAVIAMVAVARGAQRRVEREIAAMGDDWVVVWYEGNQRGGVRRQQGLPPNTARNDAAAILDECSAVRAVALANRTWGGIQVISGFGNCQTTARGVEPLYFDIRRWGIVAGRTMTDEDMQMRAKVCWLGETVREKVFGSVNPIGQTVRLNGVALEVVGVLVPKGSSADGHDLDDEVLLPFSTYQPLIGGNEPPRVFFVASKPGYALETAKDQMRTVLRRRHRLADDEEDTFRMYDRGRTAEASEEATNVFNMLLTSIASISLLVGGVGIMNIMLVSVTERTREIGLRMA
ncbi:MAG: ABC transporter permease, partial [Phycisphaerae bacterium]|nr:ABC transporter permease [Phycisphaerae bacterium]